MEEEIKRVALYMRVSTEQQAKEGDSIPAQKQALEEHVSKHENYILVGEYIDRGISGRKSEEREELQRLLTDVKADKIDLILFTKLDRWYRSVKHYVNTQDILDEHGVVWKAIWEPNYETVTAQGRLFINQMLSFGQFEAELASARINEVFRYKVQQGETLTGTLPYGYRIENKKYVLVPEEAETVRDVFNVFISSQSIFKAAERLGRQKKIKTLCQATKKILRQRKYTGEFRGNPNYCPQIVSVETFEKAQQTLRIRSGRQSKKEGMFDGLMYCKNCGKKMHKNNNKYSVSYRCYLHSNYEKSYHELCDNNKSITHLKVEKYLLENIEGMVRLEYHKKDDGQIRDVEADKKKVKSKLDRLKNLYIIGDIEIEEYTDRKKELEEELDKLNSETVEKKPTEYESIILAGSIQEVYAKLITIEEKRYFWSNIVERIYFDKDRKLEVILL